MEQRGASTRDASRPQGETGSSPRAQVGDHVDEAVVTPFLLEASNALQHQSVSPFPFTRIYPNLIQYSVNERGVFAGMEIRPNQISPR